ncbi:MAG: hypothetical protein Q7S46_09005, partial [Gallionella sp.]|nr:hypothetical protein [Gallionella sp.]
CLKNVIASCKTSSLVLSEKILLITRANFRGDYPILSIYSSRAVSVDFIFIAAYLILPLLLWRTIFQNSKLFLFPTFIMLIAFWIAQFKILLQAPNTAVERIDYREREVLSHILADAEARGLSSIKLGSTAMHQHNCLSYQYWALANYFPRWTGRVFTVPMGRPNSADELARTNKDADYVIVVENFRLDLNPNNVAAPAANNILQTRYGMAPLTKRFDLPDGATVRVLHGK